MQMQILQEVAKMWPKEPRALRFLAVVSLGDSDGQLMSKPRLFPGFFRCPGTAITAVVVTGWDT